MMIVMFPAHPGGMLRTDPLVEVTLVPFAMSDGGVTAFGRGRLMGPARRTVSMLVEESGIRVGWKLRYELTIRFDIVVSGCVMKLLMSSFTHYKAVLLIGITVRGSGQHPLQTK